MPDIFVDTETEGANHWQFDVRVVEDTNEHSYCVTLSWPDYDLWSRGRVAPERVVKAAFEYLLARESASSILPKFDCAVIRRYFPKVDKELPALI